MTARSVHGWSLVVATLAALVGIGGLIGHSGIITAIGFSIIAVHLVIAGWATWYVIWVTDINSRLDKLEARMTQQVLYPRTFVHDPTGCGTGLASPPLGEDPPNI